MNLRVYREDVFEDKPPVDTSVSNRIRLVKVILTSEEGSWRKTQEMDVPHVYLCVYISSIGMYIGLRGE